MTIGELRDRRRVVTDRILTIEMDLAMSKANFLGGRKGMSLPARAEIEAERATLALERTRLNISVKDEETAILARERKVRENGMLNTLIGICNDAGRGDLVELARVRAPVGEPE